MKIFGSIAVFIALVTSCNVCAVTELEELNLTRVVDELRLAQKIAQEADSHSSPSDRTQFDYKKLVWNLSEMASAIERHIEKPSTAPRRVDELYTELSNE